MIEPIILYWNANEYCETGKLILERAIDNGPFEVLQQFEKEEIAAGNCTFEHLDQQWPQAAQHLRYRLVHIRNQQKKQ